MSDPRGDFEKFQELAKKELGDDDELLAMLSVLEGFDNYLDEILETGSATVEIQKRKFEVTLHVKEITNGG